MKCEKKLEEPRTKRLLFQEDPNKYCAKAAALYED